MPDSSENLDLQIIQRTKDWVDTVVIGLNLCPFAKREIDDKRVHFCVSNAHNPQRLLASLHAELVRLEKHKSIETTLLIHPHTLQDFSHYNEYLDLFDALISDMQLEGIYQIASFHPQYRFAGTRSEDVENYTNRSPYPMLHLIREQSLAHAVATYPEINSIPKRNIDLLRSLGFDKIQALIKT
jgi:hypothetical protein